MDVASPRTNHCSPLQQVRDWLSDIGRGLQGLFKGFASNSAFSLK